MVSLWPLLFTDTSRSRGGEGAGAGVSLKKKLNIKLTIHFRVIGACVSSLPSNLAFPF